MQQVIDSPLPPPGIHWKALKEILIQYGLFLKFPHLELKRTIFFHGDPTNTISRQRICAMYHHQSSGHVTLYFQCPLEERICSIVAQSPKDILSCIQFVEMFLSVYPTRILGKEIN